MMIRTLSTQPSARPAGRIRRGLRKGFSLVELLAVMTIIAVLLSLASVGINKIGKGQGVTSGMALAEGLLSQARSLAMNNTSRARLIIHSDLNDAIPEERERYRRLMAVVYKKIDPVTGKEEQEWTLAGSPTFLPSSTYFSPDLSLRDMREGGDIPTDRHQLSKQADDLHQCYYYEFNSQGICSTPGAGFVVEEGPRPTNAVKPILGKVKSAGGFVILRNGSTSIIRDIKRLNITSSN